MMDMVINLCNMERLVRIRNAQIVMIPSVSALSLLAPKGTRFLADSYETRDFVFILMKILHLERLRRLQRQYHQSNPWRLSQGGLYIPHSYTERKPDNLSWWDDVGFILNGRRIIVWWQHPRYVYSNAIEELAWKEAGDGPQDNWITDGATKNYKKVGKSRKKIVSYTCRQPSVEQRQHYDLLRDIEKRLTSEGIDYDSRFAHFSRCKINNLNFP